MPSIPSTQKAAIFRQKGGPVKIEEVPVVQEKDLKPGEALVNVVYSGVCHTDLHAMLGDWPLAAKVPLIGGHEGAGYVVAIAANTVTDLKVGDPVGIKWLADSCMHCEFCRKGFEPNCPNAKLSGFTHDGSFQQYAVSFANHLTKIPKELPLDQAAPVLCAGVTVYTALKNAQLQVGDYVIIPGAGGGLGHLALQYAREMGLRTIAVDTGSEKKALCERLGAEKWIDFKEHSGDKIIDAVKKSVPDGLGPHGAIITSASAVGYEQAMAYIRPRGVVVAVGLPANATIQANVFWTVFESKRLVGSYVGNRQDAAEALALAASGKVRCEFKTQSLGTLPQVYDDMKEGKLTGRVVLDLSK